MSKPVLLTVDDDAAVLSALERDLVARYGDALEIVAAPSGADALAELRRLKLTGAAVALIVADQRMPRMTGVELLRHTARLYPAAKRVLLTAYADTNAVIGAINLAAVHQYLLKPWDPPEAQLYPALDEQLEAWRGEAPPPESGVRVVASRWSADAHHVRDFLTRNLVRYRWHDLETDDEAAALLEAAGGSDQVATPLVVLPDGGVLERPTSAELAARVGMATHVSDDAYDIVIVGAGPAGLAAAVHAGSEGYRTLLVERHAPGGQAGLSARIENYLGFPIGLSGAELARRALAQARRFGAELITPVEAVGLRVVGGYPVVTLSNATEVTARALLIASGVQYRRIEVEGAQALLGAGVFHGGAVTEAARVTGRDVHVLGGGNAAAQAALHLARYARTVTLVVRGDDVDATMSRYLRDRIAGVPNIGIRVRSALMAVDGDTWVRTLLLQDTVTGRMEVVPSSALFVFIGAAAATGWLDGVVNRDNRGFVYTGADVMRGRQRPAGWTAARDPYLLETNVCGVFVAGDVRHRLTKGVAAAVGEGNMAAQLIHQHLLISGSRARREQPVAAT